MLSWLILFFLGFLFVYKAYPVDLVYGNKILVFWALDVRLQSADFSFANSKLYF
jgi:hypothetical protein